MLFFELFPAFVMLLSLVVGIGLYLANGNDAGDDVPPRPRRAVPPADGHTGPAPTTTRPSMRA